MKNEMENEKRFMVTIYFETTEGFNGSEMVKVATAQQAAQAVIDYAAENTDRKVIEVFIKDWETYKRYSADEADIEALSNVGTEETAEENIAAEEAVIENNTNTNAAENSVATEKTTAKFEAGKTYYVSGAVSAIKITVTRRTAKTIVVESDNEIYVNNTRYKVNDSEHGEFIKLGFHSGAKWIYAKNEYTADVQSIDEQNLQAHREWVAKRQAAYDKAWEEHQAELKAKRGAEKRADKTAIEAASKNIVEKCNSELEADPNAEHPTMARYLTTVAYKPEWQETMLPVKCFAIRSTDFARAEKALNIIKTSLTGLPIEFDEEPCIKVFDKWEDEFVPVYYVEETDGSEDDMDDEEIFDVTPADENDAEDELIDEAAEIVANVENTASEINSEVSLTSNDTPKIKVDRNALIYVKDSSIPTNPAIQHYTAVLIRAYKKFGFDMNILNEAVEFSGARRQFEII